jgi:hypothetical protein
MGGMTGKGMGRTHVGVTMGGIAGNGIGLAARVGATGMGWTLGIEGGGMIDGIWGMPAKGKTGIAGTGATAAAGTEIGLGGIAMTGGVTIPNG